MGSVQQIQLLQEVITLILNPNDTHNIEPLERINIIKGFRNHIEVLENTTGSITERNVASKEEPCDEPCGVLINDENKKSCYTCCRACNTFSSSFKNHSQRNPSHWTIPNNSQALVFDPSGLRL